MLIAGEPVCLRENIVPMLPVLSSRNNVLHNAYLLVSNLFEYGRGTCKQHIIPTYILNFTAKFPAKCHRSCVSGCKFRQSQQSPQLILKGTLGTGWHSRVAPNWGEKTRPLYLHNNQPLDTSYSWTRSRPRARWLSSTKAKSQRKTQLKTVGWQHSQQLEEWGLEEWGLQSCSWGDSEWCNTAFAVYPWASWIHLLRVSFKSSSSSILKDLWVARGWGEPCKRKITEMNSSTHCAASLKTVTDTHHLSPQLLLLDSLYSSGLRWLTQNLIPEESQTLVNIPFSGFWDIPYFTCHLQSKLGKGV